MASAAYAFSQNDGPPGEFVLPAVTAYEVLSMSALYHLAFGWSVEVDDRGFTARKGGTVRTETVTPLDGDRALLVPTDHVYPSREVVAA